MFAVLLLVASAFAGGYDQPATVQKIDVELLLPEGDISQADLVASTNTNDLKDAIASAFTATATRDDITWVNITHPHIHFQFEAGNTISALEPSLAEVDGLCDTLNAAALFTSGAFSSATLGADCVVSRRGFSELKDDWLNGNCTSGDYEVTGEKSGFPVYLNFSRSHFSVDNDDSNTSYINLDFRVPTMYFYNDQNVSGTGGTRRYNRAVAITFHDRNGTNLKTDACFGTRNSYEHCPEVTQQWRFEDDNQCSQRLVGKLPFLDLLYQGSHDPDNVIVLNDTRMINGYPTPTWDLYMVALVETWSGFIQESPLSGNGDLYFNNPYNPNSTRTDWSGHLEINAERYSFYILPFRVSFPQMITIDADQSVSNVARLIVLQALVVQRQLDINFAPDFGAGEKFGILHVTIRTQVQFPFGLRNDTDPFAPALSRQVSGEAASNPTFRDSDHYMSCENVAPNGYCVQEWHLEIVPQVCDVSGVYELEWWAACFNTTECALDNNIHDEPLANKRLSNAWSGILQYEITSQEFCPEIIDEIQTQGTITKYVDPEFLEPAVPGTNLFSNDHVYFEVTFLTRTAKANNAFSDGDDSLIQFVRPYHIEMEVTMIEEPFQTTVNADNGDVTFPDGANQKNYIIELCSVPALNFPYESIPGGVEGDCFKNRGWNAINMLDFKNWTATNGTHTNTIDDNEIAFSLRLDERVIPVDLPNTNTEVVIRVDVEIFYVGNNNPDNNWGSGMHPGGRRSLKVELPRRRLQDGSVVEDRVQGAQVQDMFTIPRRPDLLYCPLKSALTSAGFVIDVLMNPIDLPSNEREAIEDAMIMQAKVGQHLGINPTQTVEVYQIDSCVDHDGLNDCRQIFPSAGRRALQTTRYVRYYVDIKHFNGAVRFQELIMNQNSEVYRNGGVFQNKIVKGMTVDHCSTEAQVVFNEYRTQNSGPAFEAIEDSSVASFGIFFTALLALFVF